MLTLLRWLLRLTIGLIVLGVASVLLIWYFAIRSLPDYDATLLVEGIAAPVEIVRTTENVPHIFGERDEDVFFALGVAHAQDRLFQMTVLRRAAQGRLSEIYGPGALPADNLARRLGLHRTAVASLEAQDLRTRAALDAYAAGVNQWIAQVNLGAMGRGAPEFFLFPDRIAYWQPADSLAILKLMAASSSRAIGDEVLRARLSLIAPEYGPQILAGEGATANMPPYATLFHGARMPLPERRAQQPDRQRDLAGFLAPGQGIGANAFAAAPQRTAAGGALLANDPHVALTAPSLFYLARLELGSGGVIGATVPGIPAVFSGRNPNVAWGLTPAFVDDADLFIEELQPGDATRYRGLNGWTALQSETEIIRVLDGPDQTITLHATENGPIVAGIDPGLADVIPAGHVAALGWTGLSTADRSISALMGLMAATDRASAVAVISRFEAPALIVTLADAEGVTRSIAGKMPQRASEHPTQGAMPVPGWLAANRWIGTAAADQDASYDSGMVIATEEPARGMRRARLDRLLGDREIHSRDSFVAAQLDTVSPSARALLPLVGADLWFSEDPAAPGTTERKRQDALKLLAEWDGNMSEHLPEPLIYAAWMGTLQDRLIRDDLGPVADDIDRIYPAFIDAVFRDRGGASRWCDIIQSAPTEDCTTIARQALDLAVLDLSARFGPDVTSWRWGDVHQARHLHPGLGALPGLGWVMNIVQPVSGGDTTIAMAGTMMRGLRPFEATTGAGYRGVYDLADPDSSVFITSSGQSGHPFSRHYDDLNGLWRRGEYITMSLNPELARAASVGTTRLLPR